MKEGGVKKTRASITKKAARAARQVDVRKRFEARTVTLP
jgi:hypothetical protein